MKHFILNGGTLFELLIIIIIITFNIIIPERNSAKVEIYRATVLKNIICNSTFYFI